MGEAVAGRAGISRAFSLFRRSHFVLYAFSVGKAAKRGGTGNRCGVRLRGALLGFTFQVGKALKPLLN